MKKVPNPEESQMAAANSELSEKDKEQIKRAHIGEATLALEKTMVAFLKAEGRIVYFNPKLHYKNLLLVIESDK